jgi:4-hydroxybenzoate polyprenyltransferase/phosphoserine phosphatase
MLTKDSPPKRYLFVDLDGTLINTDLIFETFFSLFKKNILAPIFCFSKFLIGGIPSLKKFLFENSAISVSNLPYNQDVLEYINSWKEKYQGEVILISASDHRLVQKVADYLEIFDAAHGTIDINLKSDNKLKKILEISGTHTFDYMGNSRDDLVIFKLSRKSFLVNPTLFLRKKAKNLSDSITLIENKRKLFFSFIKLIRLHQWVKNLLLFAPMILGKLYGLDQLPDLVLAFVSFSLMASSFYIFNDLLDIESDRQHAYKKSRPFAAGEISIQSGIIIFPLLIFASIFLSWNLSFNFQIILILYAISTFMYSQYFKRVPILDIFFLSYLYVLRIMAGALIINADISSWLITFSVFFFLFLSSLKRYIEINKSSDLSLSSRGYVSHDKDFIFQLSSFSGLISVLVICLYIDSQQALEIYSSVYVLWFIPFILMYWIIDILFNAHRGSVHDDPVVYVITDKKSYICLIIFLIILIFAA